MSVELAPEATQIAAGERLSFTLINHGPGRIGFGELYAVQREEDRAWLDADVHPPGTAFGLAAQSMPARRRYEQSLAVRIDVAPGRYRVVKPLAGADGVTSASFEFEVLASPSST